MDVYSIVHCGIVCECIFWCTGPCMWMYILLHRSLYVDVYSVVHCNVAILCIM